MFQQTEREIGGRNFRIETLDVFQQFDVARKMAPVMSSALDVFMTVLKSAGGVMFGGPADSPEEIQRRWDETRQSLRQLFDARVNDLVGPLARALADMPDADARFVMDTCLKKVSIQQGAAWVPLMAGNVLAFQDVTLPTVLALVWLCIQQSLAPFSLGPQGGSPSAGRA